MAIALEEKFDTLQTQSISNMISQTIQRIQEQSYHPKTLQVQFRYFTGAFF